MVTSVFERYLLCAVAGRRDEVKETDPPGATCELEIEVVEEGSETGLLLGSAEEELSITEVLSAPEELSATEVVDSFDSELEEDELP